MALTAAEVLRDYETDGVPSSGVHEVKKSDFRTLLGQYEQIINAFTSNGGLIYDTRALLYADLAKDANRMAWVIGDSTAAYNGIYKKVGASGSGSWTRVADLPYSFIVASDVGDGTPDAIVATSSLPISGSALVLLNVYEANTGSPVTVSFNGGTPLTIKTNSGNDIAPGGLQSGMLVLGRVSGSTFRIVTDQVSAAIVAQAEAAAAEAVAAAASLNFPPLTPAEAGYGVFVNAAGDGYEYKLDVGKLPVAYTIAQLESLPLDGVSFAYLAQDWRQGAFRLRMVSSLSAAELAARAADTQQGLFVDSTVDPLYVWHRVYSGALNVHWFDVPGDLSITKVETYNRLDVCWYVALALGHDIYHPAGIYDCGENNFPYRQKTAPTELLDCKRITIFGDGANTILRTTSVGGADVIQLYGIKSLRLKDFRITSDVSGSASGSNGISIVGGSDDIVIDNLDIGPLRGLDKGGSINGGKALTYQSEAATLELGTLTARYRAIWCAQGFGFESNLVNMQTKKTAIDVEFTAERCYVAAIFVAGAAEGAVIPSFHHGIRIKGHAINCQRAIWLNRAHGLEIDMVVNSNVGAASTKATDFWGNFYRASDIVAEGMRIEYAQNCRIKMVGNMGHCAYYAQIGSTTAGSSGRGGQTESCDIYLDLSGTPSVSKLNDIGSAPTMTASWLRMPRSMITAAEVPASFKALAAGDANIIYRGTELVT